MVSVTTAAFSKEFTFSKECASNKRAGFCESNAPPAATRMAAPTDAALIKSIARGDRHAMALLYARYSVRVYRFAVRTTGNATLADDITSEVFLEVWRKAGGFKEMSQLSTWLLAITRYKSLSAMRHRADEQLDDQEAAEIEDLADDPESTVLNAERSVIVEKCLSRLSKAQREVIDLVYHHDKSVVEVAQIVGAPAATVKTRMFYARRRLGELLNGAGIGAFHSPLSA